MSSLTHSPSVEVGEDGAILRIPDLSEEFDHVVYAQHSGSPLSNSHPAFTVKIVKLSKDAVVGIGICDEPFVEEVENEEEDISRPRTRDAIIYHNDNGSVARPSRGSGLADLSPYGEGDTVTYVIEQLHASKSLVCVLKNGRPMCRCWVTLPAEKLFPTVNVWWGPVEMHVDWLCSTLPSFSMTNLMDWMVSDDLKLEGERLTLPEDEGGRAQAPHPLQPDTSLYFEMTVGSLGEGETGGPMIGLTSATWSLDEGLPGDSEFTIGYNVKEGMIKSSGQESKDKNLGEAGRCKVGDTVGCGVMLVDTEKASTASQLVVVYFTRNRDMVLHHCHADQSIGGFYPTLVLMTKGASADLKMDVSPPPLPDESKWRTAAKKAIDFPGLGMFSMGDMIKEGDKHEEGVKQGQFRFSELIGCPTSDTIRPQNDLVSEKGWPVSKLLQLLRTITPSEPYFMVQVKELGEKSDLCIGISREGQSCGSMPGALVDSVGYSSSGRVLLGGTGSFHAEKFAKDDVIGVYVDFMDLIKVVQVIKNGKLMGQCIIKGSNKDIYPSIGFSGLASTVQVTWPIVRPTIPPTYSKDDFKNWLKSPGLVLNGSKISVEKKQRKLKGNVFISPQPLCHKWNYFEVQIECPKTSSDSQNLSRAPVIGLTNVLHHTKYKKVVNQKDARDIRYFCHKNSIGYTDYLKHEMVPLKTRMQSGDRVGWGVYYPQALKVPSDLTRQVVVVYCCLNGAVVYHKPMEQPGGGFYPSVALYKYGEEASLLINSTPRELPSMQAWIDEADAFRIEVDKQRKAAEFVLYLPYLMRPILPSKRKFRRGQYKQTAEDRRARPATAVKRPDNHLKKYTIYIHCDPVRYNEATHIQARLDEKGLITSLLPEAKLNSTAISSLIDDQVTACTAVVCCMGPEISETQHMGAVLQLAQQRNKPVLPFILERLKWPPEGALQHEWQKLVMHKIETSGDFDWAIEQIEEKTMNLKGKGYNGKEIRVLEGKGAKMLYTDAQKGNQTTNERSDPNALKKAIDDADKMNQTSLGNTATPEDHGDAPRSLSFSSLQEPKHKMQSLPQRPHSSHGGRVNQSKTCTIL